MTGTARKRDLISIADLGEDLPKILARAAEMKGRRREGDRSPTRPGFNLAMIFEKPSTRTRTSFEVAANDLGGHGLYMSSKDLQLGRGETIADTARVLSRYVDAIAYRAFRHADVLELARWATVPVINGLDDREHPCQAAADLLTLRERWPTGFTGRTLAYVGDGNNVLNSLLLASAMVGLNLTAAIPMQYRPPKDLVSSAESLAKTTGATLRFVEQPVDAARGADAVYTDVWVSMGEEGEAPARSKAFRGFQVNSALLSEANPAAFVLHDLPAHRGEEITDEVMDGPRAAVWDQAENRLHAQKAILEWVLPEKPAA